MKLRTVLLASGLVVGGYLLFGRKKVRFAGDLANVGDDVQVPITSLPASVPGLPQGVGFAIVKVQTVSADTLSGFVTGFQVQSQVASTPLNPPVGPIQFGRSLVTGVARGGQIVA